MPIIGHIELSIRSLAPPQTTPRPSQVWVISSHLTSGLRYGKPMSSILIGIALKKLGNSNLCKLRYTANTDRPRSLPNDCFNSLCTLHPSNYLAQCTPHTFQHKRTDRYLQEDNECYLNTDSLMLTPRNPPWNHQNAICGVLIPIFGSIMALKGRRSSGDCPSRAIEEHPGILELRCCYQHWQCGTAKCNQYRGRKLARKYLGVVESSQARWKTWKSDPVVERWT